MDVLAVINRNRELRQQAKDCYGHLSNKHAILRRHLVVAKYTCVHVGLVIRGEYDAADLMQDVIDDVRRPLQLAD